MFSKLTAYIDHLSDHFVPSCDIIVMRDHEVLYRHMMGHRDEAGKEPLRGDETYCLYSCSKVTTTLAAMQLIEQGKLSLDAPVADYLPAYQEMTVREGDTIRPAKTVMTVRHLMSMQSGLDYDLDAPELIEENKKRGGHATTRQMVDALAKKPLNFDPGTDFLYSLSHDVLAAVIEAASGMKFSDYLNANIFAPAGMTHTGFYVTEENQKTQCAQYMYESDDKPPRPMGCNDIVYALTPAYESGGAGLISSAEDYAALADALACGETKTGVRLLSDAARDLWRTPQLCPKGKASFDTWCRYGYDYALGVRTRVDDTVGRKGPVGEFGWDGAAASYMLIDPEHHLSYFMALHVRNFGYAYSNIHPDVQNLVYEALGL